MYNCIIYDDNNDRVIALTKLSDTSISQLKHLYTLIIINEVQPDPTYEDVQKIVTPYSLVQLVKGNEYRLSDPSNIRQKIVGMRRRLRRRNVLLTLLYIFAPIILALIYRICQ